MGDQNCSNLSRRVLLQKMTAGAAALGSAGTNQFGLTTSSSPVPSLTNPNILIIMVDQFRAPAWLNPRQQLLLNTRVLPNIFGRIRDRSVVFTNYFVAAAACSPSRSALLTGLYSHQTAVYRTQTLDNAPDLLPAFPTWGGALATLNSAYEDNVWWFGKWHLTRYTASANPLGPYGFKTRLYPSARYPSPDGAPNEGTNGGPFPPIPGGLGDYAANDSDIAGDFIEWISEQPSAPWCATVSFVNPHDIGAYPAFFPPKYPPPGQPPCTPVSFPPPASPPSNYLYAELPSPWNYESPQQLAAKKIGLQMQFFQGSTLGLGQVSDWVDFLNWYYWLENFVDSQVSRVLDALEASGFGNNTIVIFTSDHGEYGGSHGLHGKAGGAYDESMHVPLYIRFPGMSSSTVRSQMCSSVDFFGLICDLGTRGAGSWIKHYPDLATRESIFNFVYNANLPEQKRLAPGLDTPYVLHTVDESHADKTHVVCMRSKSEPGNPFTGAKYAVYSQWAQGTTIPDLSTLPDQEFYDYTNKGNLGELGNDYLNPGPRTSALIEKFQLALGSYGPFATGIIKTELRRPLVGIGTDGQLLRVTQQRAIQAYLDYVDSAGCLDEIGQIL